MPADIRLGFVKKVYSLLICMLSISFVIATPFVFNPSAATEFMAERPWLMGFFMLSFIALFFPGPLIHKVIAACGAVLFSFVIIYDTQLIFGTQPLNLDLTTHSPVRKVEFTVDMYAFAAYQLYLDFVNMFLYLLKLFGERREN